jgi:hypothetical protein
MTNPNPSPELLQRARLTLADARIAAGSLIGDCPDDVAVSAMLSFAALSQTPPAPSLSTDVQSAAAVFHEQDVSLKVALPAPGEVEEVGRIVKWIDEAIERTKKNGATEGVWLSGSQWRVVRAALATVAAANDVGVADAACEALEGIAEHAETRIKDGKDLGANIWKIALEDTVRDARAAICLLSQKDRREGWTEKGREWLDTGAPLATSRSQHEGAE